MDKEMDLRDVKTFITVISQQGEDELGKSQLHKIRYEAADNLNLDYNKQTRFPIMAAMNGYIEKGDKIRVIAIYNKNDENMKSNYKLFTSEVEDMMRDIGIPDYDYSTEEVIVDSLIGRKADLKLFEALLDKIKDDEILHICITYGIKALPIILFDVAQYAWKVKKNDIECILYGNVDRKRDKGGKEIVKATIYDITSLFYKHDILMRCAELGDKNPIERIRLKS